MENKYEVNEKILGLTEKTYEVELELEIGDFKETKVYKFKKPATASLDRYMKKMSDSMVKASAAFLMDNVMSEDKAKLEKDLEEYPALVLGVVDKLMAILGMPKDANLKRL